MDFKSKAIGTFDTLKNKYYGLFGDNDYNMVKHGHMKYAVRNNHYRDIYSRDIIVEPRSKFVVWFIPSLAVGLVQFFVLVVVPAIFMMVVPGASGHYFKSIWFLYFHPFSGLFRGILMIVLSIAVYKAIEIFAVRYWESQTDETDADILNNPEYQDDSQLTQPEELSELYDIAPDAGAHMKSTDPTAIVGHLNLTNVGVNKIEMVRRADGKTDVDEDGNVVNKNVELYDENDELAKVVADFIDEDFGERLWDSSGIERPYGENAKYIRDVIRHRYDPDKLLYNPAKKFGKSKEKTVAEKINNDWYFPEYEVQRPAGCYIVDTEPNNTMVLAMTRAGKGQTVIEPTIDLWLRSDAKSNIVCNDPKGELYVKFFYVARKRGYRVVVFNLINSSKTDIYNPLGYAIDAARQGDNEKIEEYVGTIGDVFFPPDKADDPMWPNAANASFQRTALGLIDYYMEEEYEIRRKALAGNWSTAQLERELDESWGHVTLYNVYQMMTQLASKKSKDASFIHLDEDDPTDEKDYLTLFFDATAKLPTNALRTSIANQDNSLRAMAGSDKTISSVYGIALTAIKFFATNSISRLTSGRPSQNFDIVGMSFPRRFDIKMNTQFVKDMSFRGQGFRWEAFSDSNFTQSLGEEFMYENNVTPRGWLSYVTKGIFPNDVTYFKLDIFERSTHLNMETYYFKFVKNYEMTLDGRFYKIDPVSKERIIKDGYFMEMKPINGKFVRANTMLDKSRVSLIQDQGEHKGSLGQVENYKVLLFEQFQVHYSEESVFVDFITPPHLKSMARIILILINQMFNMQVDKSYLTLDSQKPYFKTKYMLDEVGNLSSDGSGIPDLQTKESIGLGQGQEFTLILQTLQQLKDVYGDSIDKILQGNTGNILYIKSTDDSMLEILQGLSGQRHRIEHDSITRSTDMYKVWGRVDGKRSDGSSVKEVPVISKNDMLRVKKGDLMVFGKGNPVWNTNQCAMPYSFELHKNTLRDFEHPVKYNLQTVPTTTNTMDFDILNNQPNFIRMVAKRLDQARLTDKVIELFKDYNRINGRSLSDDDLSRMDPEDLARELMLSINQQLEFNESVKSIVANDPNRASTSDIVDASGADLEALIESSAERNDEFIKARNESEARAKVNTEEIYADGQLSRSDLARPSDDTKECLVKAYIECLDDFKSDSSYKVDDLNNLYYGSKLMIKNIASDVSDQFSEDDGPNLNSLLSGADSKVDEDLTYEVQDAWFEYLQQLPNWHGILDGKYDSAVASVYRQQETV